MIQRGWILEPCGFWTTIRFHQAGDLQDIDMEIISIPLEGDLEHQDSTGNKAIIREGDIQVMNAGSGIFHSEKIETWTSK